MGESLVHKMFRDHGRFLAALRPRMRPGGGYSSASEQFVRVLFVVETFEGRHSFASLVFNAYQIG